MGHREKPGNSSVYPTALHQVLPRVRALVSKPLPEALEVLVAQVHGLERPPLRPGLAVRTSAFMVPHTAT